MRVVFIHGFGENPEIFDQIAPAIAGEHTFIDLWESLGNRKRPKLELLAFCEELIQTYKIVSGDLIIGHSLGGKLAHHIQQLLGNQIVQIASWTDQSRIILPIKNVQLGLWLAKRGWLFNNFTKQYMLKRYRRAESKPYYEEAVTNLAAGHRRCVYNQLRLVLAATASSTEPTLRIHAKRDNIIRYPKDLFYEVPGDHFSLKTHPEEVVDAIHNIL